MNLKIFPIWGCFIPQLLILNSEMKDLHWYLVWLSCNIKHITAISNLHFNRKQSTLTYSNVPQVMEKWFMANLHASLDSTWKSRISIISTRCQNLEWGSIQQLFILKSEMNLKIFPIWGCFIPQLLILNSEMKDLHWYLVWLSCNIKHITAISNLHFNRKQSTLTYSNVPQVMEKWFMANLHASLDRTWKSRISIISTRCQNLEWGSIQQLFILKPEMNLKIFPIWGFFIPQLFILKSEMKDLH